MSLDTILTPTQEQVLSLIAGGATSVAAAKSAGIHRNTIGNWLRSSPAFKEALAAVHFERVLRWREQAETLAPCALETIRDIMSNFSAPAGVRLKAALAILDKAAAPLPLESVHNSAQSPAPAVERREPDPALPDLAQPAENTAPITPRRTAAKLGRNETCPCGSGKKFKRCCLALATPSDTGPPLPRPMAE
jgi:hypothetical protein